MITNDQVETEKQKIIAASKNLVDDVEEFISTLESVQEVIEGVKVAAKTCGGHQTADKISQIANMEIDKNKIQNIASLVSEINVYADPNTKKRFGKDNIRFKQYLI